MENKYFFYDIYDIGSCYYERKVAVSIVFHLLLVFVQNSHEAELHMWIGDGNKNPSGVNVTVQVGTANCLKNSVTWSHIIRAEKRMLGLDIALETLKSWKSVNKMSDLYNLLPPSTNLYYISETLLHCLDVVTFQNSQMYQIPNEVTIAIFFFYLLLYMFFLSFLFLCLIFFWLNICDLVFGFFFYFCFFG